MHIPADIEAHAARLRFVIATLERKGLDATDTRKQLAAAERMLAEGVRDPGPEVERVDATIGISATRRT